MGVFLPDLQGRCFCPWSALWELYSGSQAWSLPTAVEHIPREVPGQGGIQEEPFCTPAGLPGPLPDALPNGVQGSPALHTFPPYLCILIIAVATSLHSWDMGYSWDTSFGSSLILVVARIGSLKSWCVSAQGAGFPCLLE